MTKEELKATLVLIGFTNVTGIIDPANWIMVKDNMTVVYKNKTRAFIIVRGGKEIEESPIYHSASAVLDVLERIHDSR